MSLQVAFGGGKNQYLLEDDGFLFSIYTYFEPGFNIMFPLEFEVSTAIDTIYIALRKRSNIAGTSFSSITANEFTVSVTDATTGEAIPNSLSSNTINDDWNESSFNPLVLTINNVDDTDDGDTTCRIRSLNVIIKEISTNDFIFFRILLIDDSQSFSYLTATTENVHKPSSSSIGTKTVVQLYPKGSYTLLTPAVSFSETTAELANFSYPVNRIHYALNKTYNDEEYDWSIDSVSDSDLTDVIDVRPVPNYAKVGLVRIDGYAAKAVSDLNGKIYFDVQAKGKTSGTEDIFRFYLKKNLDLTMSDLI